MSPSPDPIVQMRKLSPWHDDRPVPTVTHGTSMPFVPAVAFPPAAAPFSLSGSLRPLVPSGPPQAPLVLLAPPNDLTLLAPRLPPAQPALKRLLHRPRPAATRHRPANRCRVRGWRFCLQLPPFSQDTRDWRAVSAGLSPPRGPVPRHGFPTAVQPRWSWPLRHLLHPPWLPNASVGPKGPRTRSHEGA